ncbi:ubiquinone biosynthesis protein-like protein [Novymonas esmeraldas]|uniref:Ubiquinone biosynthesis protein COQ4 homolog, mitochondrial n=1 Tax=Novymonas esmeraldas TaxID=1808958 RepID=A0AAW0EV31_9TRYP
MQWLPLVATGAAVVRQTGAFAIESLKAIRDPTDADAVSAVGELSSLDSLERVKSCMMADKRGRHLLKYQPIVGDEALEYSRSLAPTTFGFRYAAYMDRNHFTPNGRTAVRHIADPTLAYVMTRYRQCHDFLHTIAGCGRTVEEELAVKILEWKHTGLPLGLLSLVGGAPHLTAAQRARVRLHWEWAADNAPCSRHGAPAVSMYLNVMWEDMLARDYDDVVAHTGITPLPVFLAAREASSRAHAQL